MSRQSQSAGDNSTQILASGDVIVGVTEERAREISEITAREVLSKYAEEGIRTIQERIAKLDDKIIASLIREGHLEVFTDPGFQRSYKHAQEGAAVSDRESDYDLLSGLLIDRAKRGETRTIRAGIERSIEIVDQIDDEALRGLTVLQAILQYVPTARHLSNGLDTMASLFEDLIDGPLPLGADWLDHLDILDAIRINQMIPLKPFPDYYPSQMIGYLASGQKLESFEWPFTEDNLPLPIDDIVLEHELRPGYVRLAVADEDTLVKIGMDGSLAAKIIDHARDTMGFGEVDPSLVDPFMEKLRCRPTLSKIEEWWTQIPFFPQITAVGRVLARANALRLDVRNVLPPID